MARGRSPKIEVLIWTGYSLRENEEFAWSVPWMDAKRLHSMRGHFVERFKDCGPLSFALIYGRSHVTRTGHFFLMTQSNYGEGSFRQRIDNLDTMDTVYQSRLNAGWTYEGLERTVKNWIVKKAHPKGFILRGQEQMPSWIQKDFPLVKRLGVGLCCGKEIRGHQSRDVWIDKSIHAHAHSNPTFSFICFPYENGKIAFDMSKPTVTFLHEYAHLQTPKDHHGEAWRMAFQKLLDKYYPGKEAKVTGHYDNLASFDSVVDSNR